MGMLGDRSLQLIIFFIRAALGDPCVSTGSTGKAETLKY
jgi:hypothetical protein